MTSFWISPEGAVHEIPDFGHEPFARARGTTSHGLIRREWIRGFVHEGYFGMNVEDLSERTLRIIEDFLLAAARRYPRWMVVIESDDPMVGRVSLMDRDVLDMGLADAVHRARMETRFGHPGLSGGEFEFWFDPEIGDIACEIETGRKRSRNR